MAFVTVGWCLLAIFITSSLTEDFFGGEVKSLITLPPIGRPYTITKDIIVERSGNLTIEPGVELQFSPGVGVTVRGVLIAKGSHEKRIIFTRAVGSVYDQPETIKWPEVRLVDGSSILDGRLQIFNRDKWWSVCTNSKNWTEKDLHVMCRHLGFSGGVIHEWFRHSNHSRQLMYQNPECNGNELSILSCPNWPKSQFGSGVCDFHYDIGIQCEPTGQSNGYWKGILFENALSEIKLLPNNLVYQKISLSYLENTTITYAGQDSNKNSTSALEIRGIPPKLKGLDIRLCAYNGINISQPSEAFDIEDTTVADNRGYGIFINSSTGLAGLNNVNVKQNGGDGIKYIFHDLYVVSKDSFCMTSDLGYGQKYPVRLTQNQERSTKIAQSCERLFQVQSIYGHTLTVHFSTLLSDEDNELAAGHIKVFDGSSHNDQLLASFSVINGTRPQSITSSKNSILIRYDPPQEKMLFFTVEVVSNIGKAYDLNLTNCNITANNGRGLVIENQRSGTFLNWTRITENTYAAGMHVLDGSGDVLVNNSIIGNNVGDGINVSYSGGFKHFDRSYFVNNTGSGLSFWFNETSQKLAFNYTSHLSYSVVAGNDLAGVFIGNLCRSDSFWNISMNTFEMQDDNDIEFLSCWRKEKAKMATIQISHNVFYNSKMLSFKLVPALNVHAIIQHNNFTEHNNGVLLISNQNLHIPDSIAAKVEIYSNVFTKNRGSFICSVGLSEKNSMQELLFTKNHIYSNTIQEPFSSLNPRSRAAAAVVVSSSNAVIYRNYFNNPQSVYELSSHVTTQSAIINASYNYWGTNKNSTEVYKRIFDMKDRYNLAEVQFQPFILSETNLDATTEVSDIDHRHKIMPFVKNNEIGGEVTGEIKLESGFYTVTRDVYVKPGSKLTIAAGTTLNFSPFIGIMIQGELHSEGTQHSPIKYTLASFKSSVPGTIPVRLSNLTEGLLEVQVDNRWGSVCSYGWDIEDAAVVCHQLGLVLNPHDWLLERSQFLSKNQPIILTNVQCTNLDIDLVACKSERDFENSCVEEIGIRCYTPSWAGLRLGMAANESLIKHSIIEKAGILDYSTNSFKPALQVDFNHHRLEELLIRENSYSGLGIMWNDIFYNTDVRKIINSNMSENSLHGIVLHSQGIEIDHCVLHNNLGSGVHYDPVFTHDDQEDLISWINKKNENSFITIPKDIQENKDIKLYDDRKYLVFERHSKMESEYQFRISTNAGQVFGIIVLSPLSSESSEELIIYGSRDVRDDSLKWDLRKNLTSFPLKTPGYTMTIVYKAGNRPDYSAILYITSLNGRTMQSENDIKLNIKSAHIVGCTKGISSNHYNADKSYFGDYYHRYNNETIMIKQSKIELTKEEAIFVWTPFWDPSHSNLAEIKYQLIENAIYNSKGGIVQHSRDILNSNNLFHWTINDTIMEGNQLGGVDIRFPYVWQYSENYTHTFVMHNSSFTKNKNFVFSVGGHFSRVNITNNVFSDNYCKDGVLFLSGMEKELLIEENVFTINYGRYIVEFNMQSHTDKFGIVKANFRKNLLKNNRDNRGMSMVRNYEPSSYTISVRGVQQVNITRNIFDNRNMQFEFLAGIETSSAENVINVAENWWGKINPMEIKQRIFDFDDWNSFAIAEFSPFLNQERFTAGVDVANFNNTLPNVEVPFGGRVYGFLRLKARPKPYVIKADLTILPKAELFIDAGVTLEFHPGVGMLILGNMKADGKKDRPIIMKPVELPYMKSDLKRGSVQSDVRLCITEECKEERKDGFLEVFNATTLQWVPVCDRRFTERNAEVVCRQLRYSVLNVHFYRSYRPNIGSTTLKRIRYWPHPLECSGTEDRLLDCEFRFNSYAEHTYDCHDSDSFVYIHCGNGNFDDYTYWGGIRFTIPNFEISEHHSPSFLSHVEIEGAGILHGEKNAAIQLVMRQAHLFHVRITKCASHGVEVISSSGNLFFDELVITQNLGTGINFVALTGESSESIKLSYKPLSSVNFPYSVFGMVDICDTHKQLIVSERILVYYKYDNRPVDCVKIFTSSYYVKQIGFRLLQFNLFNASDYSLYPDSIQIFNGNIFNQSIPPPYVLATWNDSRMLSLSTDFYKSSNGTLSIQLHASGASGIYGFIAEVMTLPLSYRGTGRDTMHNISNSEISHNTLGALSYKSAGELTPIVTISYNRFEANGEEFFGNFTSVNGSILLDVRNAEYVYFYNNLLLENQGGLHIYADSQGSLLSLKGLVTNNLFFKNQNRESLLVKGGSDNIYQHITVIRNYFTRNISPYCNNILFSQATCNYSLNSAYNNTGLHQIAIVGFEQTILSNHECIQNSFYDNKAVNPEERSTIKATTAGQMYRNNYFVNPDNDYELATVNRSVILELTMEPWKLFVDAVKNWWGFSEDTAVSGRIKDRFDYEGLLEVKFRPFYKSNTSVLSGKCAGGWKMIGSTCFFYIGGILTYNEAKQLCESDNGSIPYVKNNHEQLTEFVKSEQIYYRRHYHKFWIQSFDISTGSECTVLQQGEVKQHNCNDYLPFLCERDPEIFITISKWYQDPLAIAALAIAAISTLFISFCLAFWLCKSRRRYQEKLERRNSIRASMRSNRSLTSTGYGNICYNRRLEQPAKLEITEEKKINGSLDSIGKSPSRFSCSLDDTHSFDTTDYRVEHTTAQNQLVDYRVFDREAQLENETPNPVLDPTFDLTYENRGFIDRSVSCEPESRDWSTASDSTLNMKRALEHDAASKDEAYQSSPSMYNNNNNNGSRNGHYNSKRPLETAM